MKTIVKNARRLAVLGLVFAVAIPTVATSADYQFAMGGVRLHDVHSHENDGHCGDFWAMLPLTGIPQRSVAAQAYLDNPEWGAFPVGYENFVKRGSDPARCDKWRLTAMETAFNFSVAQVIARIATGRERLVGATISFEERPFINPDIPRVARQRPIEACFGSGYTVSAATSSWVGGFDSTFVRQCPTRIGSPGCLGGGPGSARRALISTAETIETPRVLEPELLADGTEHPVRKQLDVTPIVEAWAASRVGVFGLVFSPQGNLTLMQRADGSSFSPGRERFHHCWKMIKEPRLRVVTR